ncbi:Kinase, Wee [Giardia lamblia P15]|uniref:Kinase, Wee n=1 Tax=Giardia intestinalis (strain P15) TaxID=658858 RepID=E1F6D2_GIAIA|nr:Kinase, Wee [Giardia lamblia P15]
MILLDNRMREVPSEIQVGEPFPISFRSHESSDSALLSTELQLKALVDDESCENLDVEPKDSDHLIRSAVNTTLNSKVHTSAQSVALFASPRKAAEQTSATCTPESQIDSIQNDMLAIGRHISVGQAHSNASFTSNTTDRGKTNNPVQSIVNTLLNSPVSGVEQSDQSDLSIRSTKSSKSCNSTLHQSVVHPRSFFKTSLSDQKCHLAYQRQKEYAITQSVTSSCESTLSNVHSMPHISPLYSSLRSVVLSANPIDVAETSPESQSVSFCADGISLLRANKHRGRAISQMTRRELQIIGMNSVIDDSTTSLHERPGYCPICKLLRVPSDLRLTQHAMALCPSSSQTEEFIHYCVCAQASAFPDAGEFSCVLDPKRVQRGQRIVQHLAWTARTRKTEPTPARNEAANSTIDLLDLYIPQDFPDSIKRQDNLK